MPSSARVGQFDVVLSPQGLLDNDLETGIDRRGRRIDDEEELQEGLRAGPRSATSYTGGFGQAIPLGPDCSV